MASGEHVRIGRLRHAATMLHAYTDPERLPTAMPLPGDTLAALSTQARGVFGTPSSDAALSLLTNGIAELRLLYSLRLSVQLPAEVVEDTQAQRDAVANHHPLHPADEAVLASASQHITEISDGDDETDWLMANARWNRTVGVGALDRLAGSSFEQVYGRRLLRDPFDPGADNVHALRLAAVEQDVWRQAMHDWGKDIEMIEKVMYLTGER